MAPATPTREGATRGSVDVTKDTCGDDTSSSAAIGPPQGSERPRFSRCDPPVWPASAAPFSARHRLRGGLGCDSGPLTNCLDLRSDPCLNRRRAPGLSTIITSMFLYERPKSERGLLDDCPGGSDSPSKAIDTVVQECRQTRREKCSVVSNGASGSAGSRLWRGCDLQSLIIRSLVEGSMNRFLRLLRDRFRDCFDACRRGGCG